MRGWRPVTAFVLSLLGLGDATYLTIDHFANFKLICLGNSVVTCAAVTHSSYSYFLHIPVAVLGLAFYVVMTTVNFPSLWKFRKVAMARMVLVCGGMAFALYLVAAELLSIKKICLWCTGVHFVTFLLFVLIVPAFPATMSTEEPLVEAQQ